MVRAALLALLALRSAAGAGVGLTFIPGSLRCIVNASAPGSAGNAYGYEDGSVVAASGALHMLVSEEVSAPKWVGMRLGHWATTVATGDAGWARVGTLVLDGRDMVSTKHCDGVDHMAALWSPMAHYDDAEGRWYMTFVGYACPGNADGVIFLARSLVAGQGGVGGPYESVGGPGRPLLARNHSVPWEGAQGDDSFVAFRPPGAAPAGPLLALYGSSDGGSYWSVGLARADGIAGPWTRAPTGNPLPLNGKRAENPIVFEATPDAAQPPLLALVHDWIRSEGEGFGLSWSADGVAWAASQLVAVPGGVRAPMGALDLGGGALAVFFNRQGASYDSLWVARFAVGPAQPPPSPPPPPPPPPPFPNGTPLALRPCSNASAAALAQRFVRGSGGDGTLRLAAGAAALCVDLLGCDTGAGALELWACHAPGDTCGGGFPSSPAANQFFAVNANGTISYTHDTRFCLAAAGGGALRLLPCAPGDGSQLWQLPADGAGGAFRIQQREAAGACVDVGGALAWDGR
jgi:hypothetical protein